MTTFSALTANVTVFAAAAVVASLSTFAAITVVVNVTDLAAYVATLTTFDAVTVAANLTPWLQVLVLPTSHILL